ncbi:MAG: VTT domain-containing protein [Chloroflexota bacterium]|nr:VTT domain-containing protein [Chloroflexota bacterium]
MSGLLHGLREHLGRFFHHTSNGGQLSKRKRWLLGAFIVVAVAALCYGILSMSDRLAGFEEYGALGAFLASLITSTSIILPLPGFAIVGAIAASPASNWAVVALASGAGGAIGEFTSYLAGYGGRVVISKQQSGWYQRAEGWMRRHGSLTIFIFALTPLPFDVAGIAAGALKFPFWKYLLATLAGRIPKTFLGCYLVHIGWKELDAIQSWFGRFTWWGWTLAGVGVTLIVTGAVFMWWRRREKGTVRSAG